MEVEKEIKAIFNHKLNVTLNILSHLLKVKLAISVVEYQKFKWFMIRGHHFGICKTTRSLMMAKSRESLPIKIPPFFSIFNTRGPI